ncbi:MAG: hypothetical protein AAGC53_20670 [Actinomycetota bacterium]
MKQLMCLDHHLANRSDVRARVDVRNGGGTWLGSFGTSELAVIATTKPYAFQRPSGAPPG